MGGDTKRFKSKRFLNLDCFPQSFIKIFSPNSFPFLNVCLVNLVIAVVIFLIEHLLCHKHVPLSNALLTPKLKSSSIFLHSKSHCLHSMAPSLFHSPQIPKHTLSLGSFSVCKLVCLNFSSTSNSHPSFLLFLTVCQVLDMISVHCCPLSIVHLLSYAPCTHISK